MLEPRLKISSSPVKNGWSSSSAVLIVAGNVSFVHVPVGNVPDVSR